MRNDTENIYQQKVNQHLKKDYFIWWADTKKYYRLIYEFDVE